MPWLTTQGLTSLNAMLRLIIFAILQRIDPFGFYYETDLVDRADPTAPIHCVHVRAINATRQVVGYAEYYGIYRVIVGMGDSYDGQDFKTTYAIDPRSGQQVDVTVNLPVLTEVDLREIYDYKRVPDDGMLKAAKPIFDFSFGTTV